MKKLGFIFALIAAVCLSLGLLACDKNEHEHDYGNWIEEKPATCTETGELGHYHCSECDKNFDKDKNELTSLTIEKVNHKFEGEWVSDGEGQHGKLCSFDCGTMGEKADCVYSEKHDSETHYRECDDCGYIKDRSEHNFISNVIKAATCSTQGEAILTCSDCGETKTEKFYGPHAYDNEVLATPATCVDAGNITYRHCGVCDKYFDENGELLAEGDWIIAATGEHNYDAGEITVQPSCSAKGERVLHCKTCTATQTIELDMLAHTPEIVEGKAPTCTESGLTVGEKCSVCGLVFVEQTEIPATNHSFGEWEQVIEPTDLKDGLEMRQCATCGNIETKEIPMTDHAWGEWAYDEATDMHVRTCTHTDCGATDSQPCLFDAGTTIAPTCLTEGKTILTCQLCGHEKEDESMRTSALGHNWGDGEGWTPNAIGPENVDGHTHTHSRTCSRCGESESESCEMSEDEVIDPTCVLGGYTKQTCLKCGAVHEYALTQATGHSFGDWIYDADNTHAHKCSVCEAVETMPCYFNVEVTYATCTEGGKTTYTCSDCEHTYDDSFTEALGHVWSAWIYDGDDTPADDVVHTHSHTCSRCNETEHNECEFIEVDVAENCINDETITSTCKDCFISFTSAGAKSLGHDWDDWKDNGDGTHTRVCKRDGSHSETASHGFTFEKVSDADCLNAMLERGTCVDCGFTFEQAQGEPLGHNWGDWTATESNHVRVCQNNGDHVEVNAHTWSVSNLCDSCFYDCLTYSLVGSHYVLQNDNKMPKNVKYVIIASAHTENDVAAPVTEIYNRAFISNTNIEYVQLPSTVTTIGEYAFSNCKALKAVYIFVDDEHNLTTLGASAFSGCTALTTIELPATVTSIGTNCFGDCTSLTNITIGENVRQIGYFAFRNTGYYATASNWSDNVLYIGNHLLEAKASEATSYEVAPGTLTISYRAFTAWTTLATITLPDSLISIDSDAFLGCEALSDVTFNGMLREWLAIKFANDYSSPLCYNARFNIQGATGDITIKDVTSIPAGTFRGTAITSVTIESGVLSIGEEAFADCLSLTAIVIPDSVTYIGKDAFLGSAYYNTETNWTDGALYIGKHLIAANASCVGNDGVYTVAAGTRTIGVEAFKACINLTKVVIAESVIRIGANAFNNTALQSVEFEDASHTWMANVLGSISRTVSGADLSAAKALNTFKYYNGEWKRYN